MNRAAAIMILTTLFTLFMVKTLTFKEIRNYFDDISVRVFDTIYHPINIIRDKYETIERCLILSRDKQNLITENRRLKMSLIEMETIKSENKHLKSLVSFQDNFKFHLISSRVVMQSIENFNNIYLLNVGEVNGIKIGNLVVKSNQLIGKIIDVSDKSSKMKLITDEQVKIPVTVIGTGYNAIVVGGKSNNYLRLLYLPCNADINQGSLVVTSSQGGIAPYGIKVGIIKKVNDQYLVSISENYDKKLNMLSILKLN